MNPTETEDWLEELVERWTEVHKKSMTTLVLLRIIRDNAPADAATIAPVFKEATGWSLTERGLYRTLRRLAENDLLETSQIAAPRTGAKRKEFELTGLGSAYLQRIEDVAIGSRPRP